MEDNISQLPRCENKILQLPFQSDGVQEHLNQNICLPTICFTLTCIHESGQKRMRIKNYFITNQGVLFLSFTLFVIVALIYSFITGESFALELI